MKKGGRYVEEDLDLLLANRGFFARIFRRLFGVIERSWQMYPVGFLFGLGFDTATEVGLLGISATQASQGMSVWSILVFPALFTAGMTLMDTTDSILMLGAYGWAFVKPIRKLYYNVTITAVSVVIALVIGGLEALNLIGDELGLTDGGGFWGMIGALNDNFGVLGYVIVGIFVAAWLISYAVYRINRYDEIEASSQRDRPYPAKLTMRSRPSRRRTETARRRRRRGAFDTRTGAGRQTAERGEADARRQQPVEHAFAHARRNLRGDAMADELLQEAVADRHAAGDRDMRADRAQQPEKAEQARPSAIDLGDAPDQADDLGDDEDDVEDRARADRRDQRNALGGGGDLRLAPSRRAGAAARARRCR